MQRPRLMMGCLASVLVLMALGIGAITLAAIQGGRTSEGTPTYVALGSSFAAGADLGTLQTGSPLLCARSANGYPQQLARMRHLSIVDMSCGGAVTKNVLHGGQFFQGAQLRSIDARTRLVTITVGGNDIGYIGDLSLLAMRRTHTVFGWLAKSLWRGPKAPAERDYAGFKGQLAATLSAIHQKAPRAVVVVATYPTILPPIGTCPRLGLSPAEAELMRQVGDQLAATTRSAAEQGGAILVDMNARGAEHHACSSAPWTRGWSDAGAAPFHPTLLGAQETAKAILAVAHL